MVTFSFCSCSSTGRVWILQCQEHGFDSHCFRFINVNLKALGCCKRQHAAILCPAFPQDFSLSQGSFFCIFSAKRGGKREGITQKRESEYDPEHWGNRGMIVTKGRTDQGKKAEGGSTGEMCFRLAGAQRFQFDRCTVRFPSECQRETEWVRGRREWQNGVKGQRTREVWFLDGRVWNGKGRIAEKGRV